MIRVTSTRTAAQVEQIQMNDGSILVVDDPIALESRVEGEEVELSTIDGETIQGYVRSVRPEVLRLEVAFS